jgi:hypothetical protein
MISQCLTAGDDDDGVDLFHTKQKYCQPENVVTEIKFKVHSRGTHPPTPAYS